MFEIETSQIPPLTLNQTDDIFKEKQGDLVKTLILSSRTCFELATLKKLTIFCSTNIKCY